MGGDFMKKNRFTLLVLAMCCLLFIGMLCGCNAYPSGSNGNEDNCQDENVFNETVQREIITAYVTMHTQKYYPISEDEVSLRCYGAFDGVYVLFVDVATWAYPAIIKTEEIAGVKFIYSRGQKMQVYSDGAFYTIS